MGPKLINHQLKLYNSLSAKKEDFVPQEPKHVGMYVCGPTVYNKVHLGNVRTFLSFDMIYRYLQHLGFKVRYVRNITDVGHLLDNEEDKISKRAKLERLEPMEIAQKYTVDFHNILNLFNFLPPSIEPTATGHIIEQIEIIEQLIQNQLAYVVNGSVYFDVIKYSETENYGELSKRKIEDLIANTRALDGQTEKKNAQDFALWKKANPEHIMRWKSPWGEGFPGWHLECTVMSTKYLGKTFDIHGGGMDLKFPHHECEIAQAKGAYKQNPVKYWMHTNMLTLNGQKMSKSTGNTINPEELFSGDNDFFSKGFSPMVIRFFMLQAHYRSPLDLSNDAVLASEKGYKRLAQAIALAKQLPSAQESTWSVADWQKELYAAMDDDFNTPIAIAKLFDAVKIINLIHLGKEKISAIDLKLLNQTLQHFVVAILGLNIEEDKQEAQKLDTAMQVLINIRKEARADKNFQLSDQIRDQLEEAGIQLKDGKEGTTYSF